MSISLISLGFLKLSSYTRYRSYMMHPKCLVWSFKYQHGFRPNCKETFFIENRNIKFETNELGFRERPIVEIKVGQVLVVGDSSIEGMGLQQNETFPSVLEEKTKEKFSLQFINSGLRRTSPITQVIRVRYFIKKFKPKFVLWSLTENDFDEDYYLMQKAESVDKYGIPTKINLDYWQKTNPSFLYEHIKKLDPSTNFYIAVLRHLYLSEHDHKSSKLWEDSPALCEGILEAKRMSEKYNFKLKFMIIPFSPEYVSLYDEGNLKQKMERVIKCLDKDSYIDLRVPEIDKNSSLFQEDLMHLNYEGVKSSVDIMLPSIEEFLSQ